LPLGFNGLNVESRTQQDTRNNDLQVSCVFYALHVGVQCDCHLLAEVSCGLYHCPDWQSLTSGDLSLYSVIIITCVVMDESIRSGQLIL
jgi:hypothetical protein